MSGVARSGRGFAQSCFETLSRYCVSSSACNTRLLDRKMPGATVLVVLPPVPAGQGCLAHVAGLVLHFAPIIFSCRARLPQAFLLQLAYAVDVTKACSQPLCPCLQGKAAMVMYAQFEKDRDRNDFSLLPELHSILSGMKVGRGGAVLCVLSAIPACT